MLVAVIACASMLLTPLFPPAQSSSHGCDANLATTGLCSTNNGTVVNISAIRHQSGTDQGTSPELDSNVPLAPPPPCVSYLNDRCVDYLFERAGLEESPGSPTVTITDLAQFAPDPVTATAEPDNVGIADMPVNFLATASTHIRTGTLFGQPLTVRFTPAGYDYTYGDGTTATLTTPGRSWADLGQAQFTPTPTSHTYTERGTYTADVDVRYTAEIDFGTGWVPISGDVTTDGAPQQIRIFEAHTALVAHTCTEKPDAPGC